MANAKDLSRSVVDKVVEALKGGVIPWRKTWRSAELPQSYPSKRVYKGFFNRISLRLAGYGSPYWLTYNRARALGGHVRKGEKGSHVFFYKLIPRKDEKGEVEGYIPLLRYYTVFNAEQIEGIEFPAAESDRTHEPIAEAEAIVAGLPEGFAPISYGGDRAAYSPALDTIKVPNAGSFESAAAFYATLFHEIAHATGHKSRLARPGIVDFSGFGSHEYSREELVAEIGAATLASECGFGDEIFGNAVSYIDGWLKRLTDDPDALLWASGRASKAVDFVLGVETAEGGDDE